MTLLERLRAARDAAYREAEEIQQIATVEDRDLRPEEQNRFEAAMANVANIDKRIATAEQFEAAAPPVNPRRTAPDAATDNPKHDAIAVRERWLADPMRGYKNPRSFLLDVMAAGRNPNRISDQLKSLRAPADMQATAGSDEQGEYSGSYGGFLLPVGMSPSLLTIDAESDPAAGLVTTIPMDTVTVKINARTDKNHTSSVSGGLTVSRRAETVAANASRMGMEQITLEASSLFGLAYATEELLADSPQSFAAIIAAGFADEFNGAIMNERINGTGASGQFLGILNSPCTVRVAKEPGQAADTIVYANILKMRSRCWGYQNAVWMANHDCLPQLAQLNAQLGTAGSLVWMPSLSSDVPDVLMGRPLYFTEYCDTVGDEGDIILANWTQYLQGTLQPLQSAESIHVRFLNHERAFKFWLRNAGAPWWRSPLTTKNSSNTLSPFVTIEARA